MWKKIVCIPACPFTAKPSVWRLNTSQKGHRSGKGRTQPQRWADLVHLSQHRNGNGEIPWIAALILVEPAFLCLPRQESLKSPKGVPFENIIASNVGEP